MKQKYRKNQTVYHVTDKGNIYVCKVAVRHRDGTFTLTSTHRLDHLGDSNWIDHNNPEFFVRINEQWFLRDFGKAIALATGRHNKRN
ncbi:hypothetical protein EVB81_247 [Rhizobium phage RHph_I46]|uniref:Uncharacterized protein n=1 Tax=Rhizobium phage RHph_I1_9 TaxID=2509729 RepID=A0A7S5R9N4_9CAUD|nr:hypothetical protein PP936_gp245 [Rhizobium phage RHph_I1_9]QIG69816.1 hypothetical protein EVB81_247 [Rhizobium phage RHph_I46]QIG71097.1 hypothetical protein EVB92_247 [Rhizobium phage RHph_I9]QIG73682.1 hypothetical protein EVC04_245 [Rhizobium phage RHph_I1_9]QIG76436.1 hypothetical protein EVC25_247 [Rhizobium phage RHph_I34]